MEINYNIALPEKKIRNGGNRSKESSAMLNLVNDNNMKNMSLSYDNETDAKRKAATLKAFAKKRKINDKVEIYRIDNIIYVKKVVKEN